MDSNGDDLMRLYNYKEITFNVKINNKSHLMQNMLFNIQYTFIIVSFKYFCSNLPKFVSALCDISYMAPIL